MAKELTDRQAEVLAYIKKYIAKFGYSPSFRAIAERFDMQANGVVCHLTALEAKGYIKRDKRVARSIVVLDQE
jgi:SOS-response transcriptional repressor LexA